MCVPAGMSWVLLVANCLDTSFAYARQTRGVHAMRFPICIYDETGAGLRIPPGWWMDLSGELPALVNRGLRIDLPVSIRNEHPLISPEVLCALHSRIEGAQWLI